MGSWQTRQPRKQSHCGNLLKVAAVSIPFISGHHQFLCCTGAFNQTIKSAALEATFIASIPYRTFSCTVLLSFRGSAGFGKHKQIHQMLTALRADEPRFSPVA